MRPAQVQPEGDEADFSYLQASSRNPKLAESIAHDIAESIFARKLAPGTRLPSVPALLKQLQISRGTLREALRVLEVHGLIRIKRGTTGGVVVSSVDASDFNRVSSLHLKANQATNRDVWQARLELEPMLARLAAQHLVPESIEAMRKLLDDAKKVDVADEAEYFRIGTQVHVLVASACGNPVMDLFARSLGEMTSYMSTGTAIPPEARVPAHRDHQLIIKSILAGKAQQASKLMYVHMKELQDSADVRFPAVMDSSVSLLV